MGRWFAEKRLQDLTELEAVDSQAGIRGVVQPSLLSPAAGGVCVHLAGCDSCTITVVNMPTRHFEQIHIDNNKIKTPCTFQI